MKNQKGITLIALIITIIVMLIMVGVVVNVALTGGLFDTAREAKTRHILAQITEFLQSEMYKEEGIKLTEEGTYDQYYNRLIWENTPYTNLFLELEFLNGDITGTVLGNVYDDRNGEKLMRLFYLPTDLIKMEDGVPEEETLTHEMGVNPFNIQTKLGNNGYVSKVVNQSYIVKKDIFVRDEYYNVYYIDKKGTLIGQNKIYKDIYIGEEYINVDVEQLSKDDRETYEGICAAAYQYSSDIGYARYLAANDLSDITTINTFYFNGFAYCDMVNEQGEKIFRNVAQLMRRPDGSIVQWYGNGAENEYFMSYENNEYTMYRVFEDKNIESDYNLNVYKVENEKEVLIATGLKSELSDGILEIVEVENDLGETDEYKLMARFDKKKYVVYEIPDKEVLNMKEDLKDYNIYSIGTFKSDTVKELILPDTVKTLSILALTREMEAGDFTSPLFDSLKELRKIELSNNIQKIYAETFSKCSKLEEVIMPDLVDEIGEDAFLGCDGVTLKFKNGVGPEGFPWGGTNITITSK